MAVWTNVYGEENKAQYEGCVLNWYERNGYDDSDWYAECWDDEKGCVVTVLFDTTRCGGGGSATVDATAEVLRKAYRYYKRISRSQFDTYFNPEQAKTVRKGDMVRVTRGRKIPKGTVGKVFWAGACRNPYAYGTVERVGIECEDGEKKFLPLDYVEVIDWESRLMTGVQRKKAIERAAVNMMPSHYQHFFCQSDWNWCKLVGKEPGWKALVA